MSLKVGDYVQFDYAETTAPVKPFIGRITQIPYVSNEGITVENMVRVLFNFDPHGQQRQIVRDASALKLVLADV